MDTKLANAAIALALGNTNALCHLLLSLAERGVVSSADIDAIAHSLTNPLDELAGDPFADAVRGSFDATVSPILAQIHAVARKAEGDRETRG